MRTCTFLKLLVSGGFAFMPLMASAAIEIVGTRVIYPMGAPNVTINLNNVGAVPSLVKSWVDDGDAKAEPGSVDVPFLLTPPLTRIEPKEGQALRLKYVGGNLPQDRESVYWLNVLDIPPETDSEQDHISFAIRSRIKIFVRPKNLAGSPEKAVESLNWQLLREGAQCALQAHNASAFHVSVARITVPGQNNVAGKMIAPQSSERYELAQCPAATTGMQVRTVSDYGGLIDADIAIVTP